MLFKTTKTILSLTKQLQDMVDAECKNLKRRLKVLNKRMVSRGFRFKYGDTTKFRVSQQDFTIDELKKEFSKRYREVKKLSKPIHYQRMIGTFQRAARGKADIGVKTIFNFHKKKIKGEFTKAKNDLQFCMNSIVVMNAAIKAEVNRRKKDMTYESMNRDELKTMLYEKYATGEITADEREELLLQAMNESYYEEIYNSFVPITESEEALLTESVNELDEDDYNMEMESEEEHEDFFESDAFIDKYNVMRAAIYEKCARGYITETERESLLQNLREYLTEKEGE